MLKRLRRFTWPFVGVAAVAWLVATAWPPAHAQGSCPGDIDGALNEIGCSLANLPLRLRTQLEAIGTRTQVPPMRELESGWPSRRSFYRAWKDSVHEPPSAFLRRARLRHAERLIALGRSKKEAAHLAGFSSPEQMRRHIKK